MIRSCRLKTKRMLTFKRTHPSLPILVFCQPNPRVSYATAWKPIQTVTVIQLTLHSIHTVSTDKLHQRKIQLRWARRRRWQWFMPFYETIAYHCIALNANHIPVFSAESERDQLDQKGSDSGGQQGHHRTASTFWWPHLSGERVATCSLHIQLELEAILGIVYC